MIKTFLSSIKAIWQDLARTASALAHLPRICNFYLVLLAVAAYLFVPVRTAGIKDYQNYHPDEYHTIFAGMVAIQTGKVVSFRVPEAPRLLMRVMFPVALIRMNQVLGGDHLTLGWEFSDTEFLLKHYPQPGELANPSIQDFLIALRSMAVLLMFASFLPLLFECFKRELWLTPVVVLVCVGMSQSLYVEQLYFYAEPLQLATLNLLLAAVLYSTRVMTLNWITILGFGAVAAFAVAAKVSAVFATTIPASAIIYLSWSDRSKMVKYLILLFASVVGFFLLYNYPGLITSDHETYWRFLHETTSNFWHYSTGNLGMNEAGWPHVWYIFTSYQSTFGYTTAALPFLISIGWLLGNRCERWIIFGVSLCIVATLGSLAQQNLYWARNSVPWVGLIAFASGYSFEIILKRVLEIKKRSNVTILVSLVAVFLALVLLGAREAAGTEYFDKLLPRQKSQMQAYINTRVRVGRIKRILDVGCKLQSKVATVKEDAVPLLTHESFSAYEKSWFCKLDAETAVIVYRCDRNFQLTNYILPKVFIHYRRFGDYFFFENADLKAIASELARP